MSPTLYGQKCQPYDSMAWASTNVKRGILFSFAWLHTPMSRVINSSELFYYLPGNFQFQFKSVFLIAIEGLYYKKSRPIHECYSATVHCSLIQIEYDTNMS